MYIVKYRNNWIMQTSNLMISFKKALHVLNKMKSPLEASSVSKSVHIEETNHKEAWNSPWK